MSRKITNLPFIYSKEGLPEPGLNLQIYNFLKQLTRFCLYQPSGIPGDKYKQKRGSFLLSVFYLKDGRSRPPAVQIILALNIIFCLAAGG